MDLEIEEVTTIDQSDIKKSKKQKVTQEALQQDSSGRDYRVRTRLCYCLPTDHTDCRFHKPTEKGWEQCPRLPEAKRNSNMKGTWLWGLNPLFGKPPEKIEKIEESEAPSTVVQATFT